MSKSNIIQELRAQKIPIYDNSSIKTFTWCPRGYFYRHELGLEPSTPRLNPGLHFGISGHLAMESWFSPDSYKDDQKALNIFVDNFHEYEEVAKIGARGKPLKTTHSIIFGCSLLEAYFNKYRNDERKVLSLENAYAEEITEDTYLVGKIDKLLETSRGLKFCDYKFTKYMNYLLNPNPQMCGYTFLVSKLTGEKVNGEVDIIGVSKSKNPNELLIRMPVEYSEFSLSLWKESVVEQIKSIERCRERGIWPQSWDCKPFFRDCDYLPLCTSSSKEVHDEMVSRLFVIKFWDPFGEE
ncbi:MAG: PD-(D/E)XK nuclease family protein [FCB group bacterium]|nr:PD-(D/E)XK nuclease family protein [FCB group bacterium]